MELTGLPTFSSQIPTEMTKNANKNQSHNKKKETQHGKRIQGTTGV